MLVDFAPVYGTPDMSVNMRKYPSRRDKSNTRKKAYEKAKRASKGKEPIHHPHGHDGNKRPHYHPNVKNPYSKTPHQPNSHDHYYYQYIPSFYDDSMLLPSHPTSKEFVMGLLER